MPPEKELAITSAELAWIDGALGLDRFFAAWTPEGVRKLLPTFALRAYPKGTEIVREGESGTEIFLLYKGTLKVSRRRLILLSREVGRLRPGDFFGEVGFLVGAPRSATVAAAEDVQAFVWSPDDMRRVLEQNEEVAKKLEAVARERIERLSGM